MFDQLVESSLSRKGRRRWRYFTATAVVWIAALTVVIAGGVVAYEGRLAELSDITDVGMQLPPSEGGHSSPHDNRRQKAARNPAQQGKEMVAHRESPEVIEEQPTGPPLIPDTIDSNAGPATGNPISGGGTKPGGEGSGSDTQADKTEHAEQPRAEKKREEQPQPQLQQVRKSGGVLQGTAIRRVSPVYPPLAKVARIAGAVVVEVVVDESGNVISARALSGHALLREAAVAAARQWKWKPTLLSDVPVQVVGTITFNFTL